MVLLVMIASLVDCLLIQKVKYNLKDIWMKKCVSKPVNKAIIQILMKLMEIVACHVSKYVKPVLEALQMIVLLVSPEHS